MSDGNFNRNLLPYNNYQSGNRAGRAQMKKIALDAFVEWCADSFPNLDDDARRDMFLKFKRMLP